MDGKKREGFVQWMCDENVFNIEPGFGISREAYDESIRVNTILSFYGAPPYKQQALHLRFDKMKHDEAVEAMFA